MCDESKRIKVNKKEIGNDNGKLPKEVPRKSGIYSIWVDGKLMYIGEVGNTLKLTGRLKQHLIKCHKKTQSKLDMVKDASEKGKEISISFIHVKPESFRLALEDELIRRKTEEGLAPWNQKSASKGEMQKWVVNQVKNYIKEILKQLDFDGVAKGKTGILKEILYLKFIENFGNTADYRSIIDGLLEKGTIIDTGSGYYVPKIKCARKKKS